MTGVCKKERRQRLGFKDTHRKGGHVMLETEIGVMLPHAKEHLGPPGAGRGKEAFSPRASRENVVLQTNNLRNGTV